MNDVITNVAILLLFAFIGWVLCKTKILKSENAKVLSLLEIWIFLPCKMFKSFSANFTTEYISEKYNLLIISAVILTVIFIAVMFITPIFIKDENERRICRYSLTVANYGYVGYALAENLYGDTVLIDMMVFVIPISLFVYTEGYRTLTGAEKFSFKRILNPVLIAIIPGMIFGLLEIPLPDVLTSAISSASACMSPISMILAGMLISSFNLKELITDIRVYIISALRLIVIPFIICFFLSRFFSTQTVLVAMLSYAMPCGLNTILFQNLAEKKCKIGISLPFISTIFSIISIPLMCKGVEFLCTL